MTTGLQFRGVALLTAMLITALIASLVTQLSFDNSLDVRRTMVQLFHEQGQQVAIGAESWVKIILRDDSAESTNDHLGELWASELPGLPVESDSMQGAVLGKIEDLNGRFNVNNLVDRNGEIDPEFVEQFSRLLIALELDKRFAGICADWIDANQEANFPDGAEDPIYTGLTPAYRTYNRPMSHISELAALEGMDKQTLDILAPHISALPQGTVINVNTATAPVLQSLDDGIDASTAERLLSEREQGGFVDINDAFQTLITNDTMKRQISDVSNYFQLKAAVQIDTVRVTYFSVLHRFDDGGPVTTLSRSLGTL